MSYRDFLATKRPVLAAAGIDVPASAVNPLLFPHQRDLVRWALRKGRSAIFADTGLGKTFMQLEWARLTGERTLILAPLSIARQTVREARKLDIDLTFARSQPEAGPLTITNYEMLHHFDPQAFGAVVLDESSILKATEGVYRNRLIEEFAETPFRLCCTATPAPNDIAEITNHSAFLGIMPRRDVLATFFLHEADDARATGWRLKNHAREAFWRWLASWGMSLKRPSDIGYSDEGYLLPPLEILPVITGGEVKVPGRLFVEKLRGVGDRAAVRRQTIEARVTAAVELIRQDRQPWIAWCGLNDESAAVAAALGDEAVEVTGSMSPEEKAERIEAFVDGRYRVLVSKVAIAGFGMNFQHCARMVFVGIGDSYEQYYQAVRRCWRFGQASEVKAYVVLSEPERAVFDNVLRKEAEAEEMARELVKHVAAYERAEIEGGSLGNFNDGHDVAMEVPQWLA
jgi:superfamily II DNA or RNA helicase